GNHQIVYTSSKIESEGALIKNDIVISNTLQKATLVHERNIGKILSLNFMKVEFKNDSLDKNYFLYLFNAYPDIQRQKERELQGTGPVRKLTKRSLENLEVPVVTLVEQQKIGAIYVETLKLQSKLTTYASMLEQFAGQVIEKSLEE
uniref:restriction endonuclease subunit S n=1 Tax=Enterococcus sp. TaxID=35783 RepID=UPI0025BA97E9